MLKRILIADEDEDIRRVLRWFIESRTTCELCGEAVNGIDAIEKARTLKPDLILLDYLMPAMNGIETGAVLKAMLPNVPVILFTNQDTRAIESAAISVGIRAVVPKTDISRLAGHIENLVAGDCLEEPVHTVNRGLQLSLETNRRIEVLFSPDARTE